MPLLIVLASFQKRRPQPSPPQEAALANSDGLPVHSNPDSPLAGTIAIPPFGYGTELVVSAGTLFLLRQALPFIP